jgi:hypothetical protein
MSRPLTSRAARKMAKARLTLSGGRLGGSRKRNAERCPCQAMTLARAMARGREPAHDPSCTFYKERAIV